jgi:hypothetical protein
MAKASITRRLRNGLGLLKNAGKYVLNSGKKAFMFAKNKTMKMVKGACRRKSMKGGRRTTRK